VNPFDFPLLADENIHPEVVRFLQEQGSDVQSVTGGGQFGHSDADVLWLGRARGRQTKRAWGNFSGLLRFSAHNHLASMTLPKS
jgi:hypothetical protein